MRRLWFWFHGWRKEPTVQRVLELSMAVLVTALVISFIHEVVYQDVPCGKTLHPWKTDVRLCGER